MTEIFEQLEAIGIVPVVVLEDVKYARPLAKALCAGGLPCAEVTFRTAAAAGVIQKMAAAYPDMLVGAGTVLTTEQVDQAVSAGASFIVSPGLNPKIVQYCLGKKIPIIPGINDPSGIEQALELGLRVVKFFPAEASGGISMIQAMSAPYASIRFMPTGGINEKNIGGYLKNPKVLACGGSFMVKKELIQQGEFDKIEEITRKAVKDMLGWRIKRIGLEQVDEQVRNTEFEIQGDAAERYIEIETNHLKRAAAYLRRMGIAFRQQETQGLILEKKQDGFEIRIQKA